MGRIKGNKKRFFYSFSCLFLSTLIAFTSIAPGASALSDLQKTIFKENNIMFWNPDEVTCTNGEVWSEYDYEEWDKEIPGSNSTDNKDDVWDGHCSGVGAYSGSGGALEKFFPAVYSVAKSNGIPWEALMAQIIQESSGGRHEACPYNPLGLKSFKSYPPACDGRNHASFKSYEEAFQYYVNNIIPVREAKNKYPNNPYKYLYALQHRDSRYAASTTYVNNTSGVACGIQKWAEASGKPVSSTTYRNFTGFTDENETVPDDDETSSSPITKTGLMKQCLPDTNFFNELEYFLGDGNGLTIAELAELAAWADGNHTGEVNPRFAELARKLGLDPNSPSIYQDCGRFVSVIVRSAVDKGFPSGGTSAIANYLKASSKWSPVENTGSTSNLKPGDVFVIKNNGKDYGHTFIYIGNGKIASASTGQNPYSGRIKNVYFSDDRGKYSIYRYTGE